MCADYVEMEASFVGENMNVFKCLRRKTQGSLPSVAGHHIPAGCKMTALLYAGEHMNDRILIPLW